MKSNLAKIHPSFWKVPLALRLAGHDGEKRATTTRLARVLGHLVVPLTLVTGCAKLIGLEDVPPATEVNVSSTSMGSGTGGKAGASDGSIGAEHEGGDLGGAAGGNASISSDASDAADGGTCNFTLCGALCTDTSTDVKNCGACGHDCTGLPRIGSTTGIGCSSGKCVIAQNACARGFAHCTNNTDDGCETDITQPAHCGGCVTSCPPTLPLCSATGCASSCSGAMPSQCGTSCANLDSDPNHCGDCSNQCPSPTTGGISTCTSKMCGIQCLSGYHRCGTTAQCASDTDATHCGPACAICTGTANGDPGCNNGTCVLNCRPGYQLCGGSCVSNAADPAETACLIDDSFGVFVSPNGNDQSGSGTKLMPYKTITKGMSVAVAVGKNVYACATIATYDEHVAVTTSGIKLYGSFDCATWSHLANTRTVVRPTTPGVVLSLTNVTSFLVEDVEFAATDALTPGDSSVAALVTSSNGVRFVRAKLAAGRGAAGSPGAAVGASTALDGRPATGTADCGCACTGGSPGDQQPGAVSCLNGESSAGGLGGFGAGHGANGPGPAQNGLPGAPSTQGFGQGGGAFSNVASYTCVANDPSTGSGAMGATGILGTVGSGGRGAGTLDSTGWHPALASGGSAGHVGQGGGGGGGGPDAACGLVGATGMGPWGGHGGSGGCGGRGGNPGGPGGSSIALVSYASTITLQTSMVTATSGGNGGNGGAGQPGGRGGDGGIGGAQPSKTPAFACSGGKGGDGGAGGPGGGGAGGHAVAIVHDGALPLLLDGTDTSLQVGSAGTGGADGNGATVGGSAGSLGQSFALLQF